MANYRELWFKNNSPFLGKYQCSHCKGWFKKSDIDIDHIIPKKYGGKDVLSNLQPLCYHCNRSKGAKVEDVPVDFTKNLVRNGVKTLFKNTFTGN